MSAWMPFRRSPGLFSEACCFFRDIGKRPSRPLDVSAAGVSTKNTLSVWDRLTGSSFLVDTGADVSVFPASLSDKKSRRSTAPLVAANGSALTLGTAADNPVCQKLINRSPPENGQLNCQEIVRSPFRTNWHSLFTRY